MAAEDLTPAIGTAAGSPMTATTDGLTVSARPMADLIMADKYLAAAAAAKTPSRGLVFTRLGLCKQVPGGGPIDDWAGPGTFN